MTNKEAEFFSKEYKPKETKELEMTLALLADLVKLPSYLDAEHNERPVIDYIKHLFETDGYYEVIEQPVEGNRSNLIIHDGTPPEIILFGHMDTVNPTIGTRDPFNVEVSDGKLYGLGSVDMKAGVAIMISSALRLRPKGVALVLTSDEEYDFKGAAKLVQGFNFRPNYILNLEPTNCEILNGCRGIVEFTLQINGKSCHASQKDSGVSAIEKTFEFYNELSKRLKDWDLPDVKNSLNFSALEAGSNKGVNPDGSVIIARSANKVPDIALPLFEIRIANPKMTESDLVDLVKNVAEKIGVNYQNLKIKFFLKPMPNTNSDLLKPLESAILKSGIPVNYLDVNKSGFYEVQMVQEAWGGNIAVFGPGPFSMAHHADEYVDISQLSKSQEVIDNFLKKY